MLIWTRKPSLSHSKPHYPALLISKYFNIKTIKQILTQTNTSAFLWLSILNTIESSETKSQDFIIEKTKKRRYLIRLEVKEARLLRLAIKYCLVKRQQIVTCGLLQTKTLFLFPAWYQAWNLVSVEQRLKAIWALLGHFKASANRRASGLVLLRAAHALLEFIRLYGRSLPPLLFHCLLRKKGTMMSHLW